MELPFAITLDVGSSLVNHTGSWRTERPVYVNRLAPCNQACPAGEDVQGWLYQAEEGGYRAAWERIMLDNPFPAIMGRVCYHPCQTACNRSQLDQAVGINSVERFLGDEALRAGWPAPPPAAATGRRVLVVGAGPAGLSAAYHLARMGHEVTMREAGDQAGGMMRYGIPAYRLPREILDAEVRRILDLGVRLELGTRVDDVAAARDADGFDAVFLAIGAQLGHRAYIPAGDSARILDAVSVLHDVASGAPPQLGRRVVVYGGGNTAMDAARSAKRLGATDAVVVYRRTEERMPAHPSELAEALAEGVVVKWLSTISSAEAGTVLVEKMELDETGFPQPTGQFEELQADTVVLALGQDVDSALVATAPGVAVETGRVSVGADFQTGEAGIFAGGDMVPADRTVTTAVGHGRMAARHIDAWLRGEDHQPAAPRPVAEFATLHTNYYSDAPRTMRPKLDAVRRLTSFDEIVTGLDEHSALFEARRCMSCGNCFECDNCYGMCPDNAVIKLGVGEKYEFNYDYCKGCGICAAECPCGAIVMEPERS